MGRNAKYTPEERAAQGNPGQRPSDLPATEIIDQFPDVLTLVPSPPDWLSGDFGSDMGALACNIWRQIAPLLVEARMFRQGDEFSFARYCRFLAEWITATQDIDLRGLTIADPRGEHRNPSLLARQSIEKDIQALEKELGLSPRARIEVQKRLMTSLKDLPLVGRGVNASGKGRGPIGALNFDPEEDDDA